jgi:hypothetical protein
MKVSVVVPFSGIDAAPNDLAIVAGCTPWTVVVAVPPLLPGTLSGVEDATDAVLEMVPLGVAGATATTSVKTALPTANEAFVQVTVPPAPMAGVLQFQPPGELSETNVVPTGSESDKLTPAAALGPAFEAVIM